MASLLWACVRWLLLFFKEKNDMQSKPDLNNLAKTTEIVNIIQPPHLFVFLVFLFGIEIIKVLHITYCALFLVLAIVIAYFPCFLCNLENKSIKLSYLKMSVCIKCLEAINMQITGVKPNQTKRKKA